MCGRFSLISVPEDLFLEFGLTPPPDIPISYNICPSQHILTFLWDGETGQPLFFPVLWGLIPFWAKGEKFDNKLINARAETAHEKASFKHSLRYRRCLIPASGFYEWKTLAGIKQPYYITRGDGKPFIFAGLWDEWRGENGEEIYSCTILTTNANREMSGIHHRMPVVLEKNNWKLWLSSKVQNHKEISHLLQPMKDNSLAIIKVSQYVNSPSNNSEDCIKEFE